MIVSCGHPNPPDPQDYTPEACINALLPYFPTSLYEDFIFVNDSTGRRWEATAYDRLNKGIYPEIHITDYSGEENGELSQGYGDWAIEISALILENGVSPRADDMTQMLAFCRYYDNDSIRPLRLEWGVTIRLSEQELYGAGLSGWYDMSEITHFPDTIVYPVVNQRGEHGYVPGLEGSYVRVVKHQGMTDFSVDGGQTIWKRVKE